MIEEEKIQYVLNGDKTYCLYDNVEQDNLLAMAYNKDQVKEESQFYSKGVWFVCDDVKDNNIILNERRHKGVRFPKEPKPKPTYEEYQQILLKSSIGDLR